MNTSSWTAGILVVISASACGCTHSHVTMVDDFLAARAADDLDLARTYLGDDPRVWYGSREGEGRPWRLGQGRYEQWDDLFNGKSDFGPWQIEEDRIWSVVEETNDYYRLIERQGTPRYRITYFFDVDGRISGYMISAAYPDRPRPPSISRFDELEAWAEANEPDEWAYLRPGGELDPTGDRAVRTRVLANRWRVSAGLEPID